MDATAALLVDGAFLLVDSGLAPQQSLDVVDSVLLARHVAAQAVATDAAGYVGALHRALGNIGWTSTDTTQHSTRLDCGKGVKDTRCVPLTVIAEEMTGYLPGDLVKRLVAEVSALERAGTAVRQAWVTPASQSQAQACLLIVATLKEHVPVLVYDYNEITPAEHALGYPWSPLTGPGTLAQISGSAAMNRTVFTTAFSAALSAKVAPMRAAAVIPLGGVTPGTSPHERPAKDATQKGNIDDS
jgi:hypothetical protein